MHNKYIADYGNSEKEDYLADKNEVISKHFFMLVDDEKDVVAIKDVKLDKVVRIPMAMFYCLPEMAAILSLERDTMFGPVSIEKLERKTNLFQKGKYHG
jgi:hypothetical protein